MRVEWAGRPVFEDGVDRGVLYSGDSGVAWSGLTSIDEKPSGSLVTDQYVDGVRRIIVEETDDFHATIQAFATPSEFDEFDGYSESPSYKRFGLSYRTMHTSGYRLHLVYNALATPSDRSWSTISSSPSPSTFSWDISATVIPVSGARPSAHLVIDSYGYLDLIHEVEDMLYGTETTDPRLPSPDELVELFESATTLRIRNNGNGTWTAEGPDDMVEALPDGSFRITAPTAQYIDESTFILNSY